MVRSPRQRQRRLFVFDRWDWRGAVKWMQGLCRAHVPGFGVAPHAILHVGDEMTLTTILFWNPLSLIIRDLIYLFEKTRLLERLSISPPLVFLQQIGCKLH